MRSRRLAMIMVALVMVMAVLAGCGKGSKAGAVTIGSKDFTESILLGELVAQLIEGNSSMKVTRKLNLGGTKVNFDGLKSGDLDMYVDYDGTAYGIHLGHTEPITNPDAIFDQVKRETEEKFKLTWSAPFGFNNTYALAMPRALAEQYGIKTYSDLAAHSGKFVFGTTNEFMGRAADGYDPMVAKYGFKFKDVKTMTAGLRYPAIEQNEIQVMDAYATDGKLKEFDMVILEDDKKFFPPYNGAVLVRMETLEKNPGLLDVLNKLGGTMTDEIMQELNYRVEVKEEAVEAVAKDFLTSKGLVK
ncbi:MAG: glycine betaine/carnitine/choline transporter substrate-binding protein [Symbiobacteriaceae bacterium]|nr:glycine betaine/carnitine/choline transporter substrate-binding protein [Symbiobacteriaceae bacterium]